MHGSHVYGAAIFEYCADPSMPVQRDLRRRADGIEDMARRMVGVKTGRLRASIHAVARPGVGGIPQYQVGSEVNYALLHHEGARPHIIHPNSRRALRFKVNGRVVYARIVRHPGTRPNRYLTIPLERYGRG